MEEKKEPDLVCKEKLSPSPPPNKKRKYNSESFLSSPPKVESKAKDINKVKIIKESEKEITKIDGKKKKRKSKKFKRSRKSRKSQRKKIKRKSKKKKMKFL